MNFVSFEPTLDRLLHAKFHDKRIFLCLLKYKTFLNVSFVLILFRNMLVFASKQSLEITYEENQKVRANRHIFAIECIIPLYNHYNRRTKMRHLV